VSRLLVLAAAASMCAVAAAPAGATSECRGLQVCVPVTGPWVLAAPGEVQFELACPKRFVVGGLDAELSSRGIDVGFVGKLGSPVNPGITTSKEAVFLGRFVRGRDRAPSFRPHIGCVPASGGGQRVPTAYHAVTPAVAPGQPVERRVFQVDVRPGKTRLFVGRCLARERLAAATHAIAFYGDAPPTAALARAVSVKQRVRSGRAELTIRASRAVAATRSVVQLDLLCVAR
jgi:hypothetical protein